MSSVLKLAVAVIRDDQDRMLVVRKSGTKAFMQPGGKIDTGETAPQALSRELEEELGLRVATDELVYMNTVDAMLQMNPTPMSKQRYSASQHVIGPCLN